MLLLLLACYELVFEFCNFPAEVHIVSLYRFDFKRKLLPRHIDVPTNKATLVSKELMGALLHQRLDVSADVLARRLEHGQQFFDLGLLVQCTLTLLSRRESSPVLFKELACL